MPVTKTLRIEAGGDGIATVQLNRPEKHNAISEFMIGELAECADWLASTGEVRVAVLAAAGKSFCSGADLGWMKSQIEATASIRERQAEHLASMLHAWNSIPKPVVARVHGNVFGGGVGLISACDAVIAARGAVFGLTETRLGLVPATISPYVVARIGEAQARRLFMSGRIFDSKAACQCGLVTRRVPSSKLDDAVQEEAASYLRSAPGAVADAKALARRMGRDITPEVVAYTIDQIVARWEGGEAQEGVSAFFEKRSPNWASSE